MHDNKYSAQDKQKSMNIAIHVSPTELLNSQFTLQESVFPYHKCQEGSAFNNPKINALYRIKGTR